MQCPQRMPGFPYAAGLAGPDHYRPDDHSCSYCGSLDPDVFMARLEAGDIALGTTTKNYKVYVVNAGGAPMLQTHRNDNSKSADPKDWTWVTQETSQAKFYFEHLSEAQRTRFIELANAGKLQFEGGLGFAPLPFFVGRA